MPVDLHTLQTFLAKTLATTYAAGKGKLDSPQRPGFEEYGFTEGEWEYRDSYAGGAISWGQENVFHQGKPVWSLVYGGGIVESKRADAALQKQAFACMKQALLQSRTGLSFLPRGPECMRWENCVYVCKWEGDVTLFRGREEVFVDDELIHFYDFAGGLYIE